MKIIALIASLLTLVYLSISYVSEQQSFKVKQTSVIKLESISPAVISKELLLVEKSWHQLKAERTKPSKTNTTVESSTNQKILMINDKTYVLYGIFNAENDIKQKNPLKAQSQVLLSNAFILIKAEDEPMKKIVVGKELTTGVVLLTVNTNEFSKMQQLVNSLLISYVVTRELKKKGIDYKFKLGHYNDHENKQSYKHVWIEHDDKIYDAANYVNDKLTNTIPIQRTNAYLTNTKKNIYTTTPTFNRIDMDTDMDKDYDNILDHVYIKLLRISDDEYLNDMPEDYKKILDQISNKIT